MMRNAEVSQSAQEAIIMLKQLRYFQSVVQTGMAIARRMGTGMRIVVVDKKLENAQAIADIMNGAGCGVGQTRGTAERHCARHHCNAPCHR